MPVSERPQKAIIFEINEVPLRIYRHFQKLRPNSAVAEVMRNAQAFETMARDVPESFLYPSQTWASLNTGAPYEKHQIHWYNDPKPAAFPLYWKALAGAGLRVGSVGTLHSSPAGEFADANPNYTFLVPDCFAADSYTKPAYLQPFQSLTLKAVSGNSRAVTLSAPVKDAALTLLNSPRYGIRASTLAKGAALVSKIAMKKVNRERLRVFQFPLAADVFLKQLKQHDPDVAILFTNHVAANMHRYWYGLFPEDYSEPIYGDEWRARYGREILDAVEVLDQYLTELIQIAKQTDRLLIMVSSMGQHANPGLTAEYRIRHAFDFRLHDVRKFVTAVAGEGFNYQVEAAMVPQYQLEFESPGEAARCATSIASNKDSLRGINVELDVNGPVLTTSVVLDPNQPSYQVKGQEMDFRALGFLRFDVDDHHSGSHCPDGSLLIYNSRTHRGKPAAEQRIDYLEYAPALLQHFGLNPPSYMARPTFTV